MKILFLLKIILEFLAASVFGIGAFGILKKENLKKHKGDLKIGIWLACISLICFLSFIINLIEVILI